MSYGDIDSTQWISAEMDSSVKSVQFIQAHFRGEASRLRRRHTKSRTGCDSCKKRKIKCDEEVPCGGCISRKYQCSLSTVAKKPRATQDQPQPNGHTSGADPASSSELTTQPRSVNLSHIHLFHHFEHVVSKLLVLDSSFWVEHVVSVSLKHELVMQAVFCMSAAHLHYLEPHKGDYREAEMQNLASTLGGLAESLESPITSKNVEVLCNCSMLLYHHAWCSTIHEKPVSSAEYYFGLESLIPLAKGVKSVMMASIGQITSPWFKVAAYRPVILITEFSKHTAFPSKLEQEFKNKYEVLTSKHGPLVCHFEIYMAECRRLVPALSALKLRHIGADISHMQSDLTRYLFTYPVLFGTEFLEAMRERDVTVQIVLAHFYVAVCTMIPEKFWWAHTRMEYLLASIDEQFMQDAFATVDLKFPSTVKELKDPV